MSKRIVSNRTKVKISNAHHARLMKKAERRANVSIGDYAKLQWRKYNYHISMQFEQAFAKRVLTRKERQKIWRKSESTPEVYI